ncbi:MAG: serine hydrolase domain-containing protein [Polyangiaceae bacterium]
MVRTPAHADDVAKELLAAGVSSRAATGCARRRNGAWAREFGGDRHRFFDLASVTKPMTAVAVATEPELRHSPLRSSVSEVEGTASADVALELLLAHRAGLEANLPLFLPRVTGNDVDLADALRRASDARRPETRGLAVPEGGFDPLYSDLGYVLVGEALARRERVPDAGEGIARRVVAALGAERTLGTRRSLARAGVDLEPDVAPTEDVAWRGGVVRGWVHDENAFALTGAGGSGHAGMFGTVAAVLAFGEAVLDAVLGRGGPFSGVDLAWLVAERPGGTLRAGFDGKSPESSSAGDAFGPRAFGHLGFTGTSLWIDPDAEVVVAVLTNRVHPTRDNVRIRAARPVAHSALFARATTL